MKSAIFYTDTYQGIQIRAKTLLNSHEQLLSPSTALSARGG